MTFLAHCALRPQVPFSGQAKAPGPTETSAPLVAATERFRQLPPAGALPSFPALLGALRDVQVELHLGPGTSKAGRVGLYTSRPLPGGETRDFVGLITEASGEEREDALIDFIDVSSIHGLRILDVRGGRKGERRDRLCSAAPDPPPLQPDVLEGYEAYLAGEVAAALKARARQAEFRVSKKRATILCAGAGHRSIRLTYLGRAEPWQVTYRLALSTPRGSAGVSSAPAAVALHAFATISNVSSEDWKGVELALVSGEVQVWAAGHGERARDLVHASAAASGAPR